MVEVSGERTAEEPKLASRPNDVFVHRAISCLNTRGIAEERLT